MNHPHPRSAALPFALALLLAVAAAMPVQARGYAQESREQMAAVHHLAGYGLIDTIRQRGVLKVGMSLFEPWVMCGVDEELIGYEVDVARKLAADMGVHLRLVPTDWYYVIPALLEDEFDFIISGMGITPERGLRINFAQPSALFGTAIVARAILVEGTGEAAFDSASVTFGARAGTLPAQVVAEHFPQAGLRLFDTDSTLLAALLASEVEAAAVDQIKAARWLESHPTELHLPFTHTFNPVPEAIALRKGDADAVNFLDGWVEHHQTSGWLPERRRFWFNSRDWLGQVTTDEAALAECEALFAANPY